MRTVMGELASMDVQRDLNYQFAWNPFFMKMVGTWPEERKWNRPSSYVFFIPFFAMLCFLWFPQTINLPLIAHDLNLVAENLSMGNMTVTISLTKAIVFWKHGNSLKSLVKCIAKDWATVETKSGRERMMTIASFTRKITIGSTILCHSVVGTYMVLRPFSLKYSDNKLFFRGYFPYDITISPNYELTMIGQAVAVTLSTVFYSTVDTFIAMLILHACGQLSNLKEDIMNIHTYDKNSLDMRMKKIVQKHEYVNWFSETVENCFNVMFLIQMIGFMIQLCFQSFQAIMSFEKEQEQRIVFQTEFLCMYVAGVMMQLFLYCYVGEKLMLESIDIADTAYSCQWYNLPPKTARLFVIIMCRAVSLPLKLTAGKFCWFTILLYSQVVKTSVSYISVLYATRG